MDSEQDDDRPLSVSELTSLIKGTLESDFSSVWVSGELSNVSRPHSGHVYLTLKDEGAQIRGVVWRSVASQLAFDLRDGLEVVCRGAIDVYPPRGAYQLVLRRIEPLGVGSLQLALRQLQQKLAAEGLFAPEHKKPLPRFPRRIALVTSPTGAAIRDFLEVLRRRWRGVDVLVIPAKVQGEGAAADLVRGIRAANALPEAPDVLVVARGGGSLEDLWCFNEELVVRAIYASRIPVVSAVGHEIDVTLSDLVADVRALTPSEAAELVVPSADELRAGLDGYRQRLSAALRGRASTARSRLDALAQHRAFRKPFERIQDRARQLDELDLRAARAVRHLVERSRERLRGVAGQLESLSPLAVLQRGYSLTLRTADETLMTDASQVEPGQSITTRLARGTLISRVEQTEQGSPP
jgi:exodeoxyribonuclease VII large subunit